MNNFEWWGIDENYQKHHDYFRTNASRPNRAKRALEIMLNTKFKKWIDFGIRKASDE